MPRHEADRPLEGALEHLALFVHPAAGVTLSWGPQARALGMDPGRRSTARWAQELDDWQVEHAEGPRWAVGEWGSPCVMHDLSAEQRFPRFRRVAERSGVASCAAYPVEVEGEVRGVLAIYRPETAATHRSWISDERALAATSRWLASCLEHQRLRRTVEQLQDALQSRGQIERAKGVLMGRLGIDEAAAFDALATRSQNENVKVRHVADQLLQLQQTAVTDGAGSPQ